MFFKERYSIILTCLFFPLLFTGASVKDEIPKAIADSFTRGNSRDLAKYFNNTIELVVLDNEDVYSKSQAELILRNFFSANKPVKFDILHHGMKELSGYVIGNLKAATGDFRVYYLLKMNDDQLLIHLLRIERVEDNY